MTTELEKARAEIDRLCAEKLLADEHYWEARNEIDRLRAENEELRGWLEAAVNEIDNPLITMHMSAILARTSKPDYAPVRDPSDHSACEGAVG